MHKILWDAVKAVLKGKFMTVNAYIKQPLSRTCTLPLEDLPGCFQRPVASTLAGCSRKPRTLLLSPGEKRFGVVPSQGPWP